MHDLIEPQLAEAHPLFLGGQQVWVRGWRGSWSKSTVIRDHFDPDAEVLLSPVLGSTFFALPREISVSEPTQPTGE